ncbi:MAG TPA: aminoacyl-tRNA hydrolase [Candidatus Babeliales bacterium]|jgi:PTH1 family peptidyl-tRNA hydrolase|nr:aminoacyl-tRNA hydrolase [Candidatus Babeliales bacterium]
MNNKIKIVIGLGNPGKQYHNTRHNIGFLVLDALAEKHHASWQKKTDRETTDIEINGEKITLVKPETFMNNSGKIIPSLLKQGIKAENLLVVHDELEKAFGKIELKSGGGHRGHNGLRSIMEFCGADFMRLRCGIGRPERKEEVGQYVLSNFGEPAADVEKMIDAAVTIIEEMFA